MKNNSLLDKTIPEIWLLLKNKKISYIDLVKEVETKIESVEGKIGAYITIVLDEAYRIAGRLNETSEISDSYLLGIPLSVKDTFTTKGIRTTAGSKILEDFIPPYDATSYARLKETGSVIIGKTNMDEFAHGFTTEYSSFKVTHNPWDFLNIPGGSSGGSAASISAREAFFSLASENFGSIIQPASYCGVVGMKPTYGKASRYGIIAMVSSLECPGIIAKCVEDVAIGISTICGWDPLDSTTLSLPKQNYYRFLNRNIKGKKIAFVKPIMEVIDSKINSVLEQASNLYKKLAVDVEETDWYDLTIDQKIYDILYRAEVSSNLARYDGIRFGHSYYKDIKNIDEYYMLSRNVFGKHVKRQIVTDPISLSGRDKDIYRTALKIRRKNQSFIDNLLKKYDALLMPASPFVSLPLGKVEEKQWRKDHRKYGLINAAMLCPTVLYGYPSISFPISIVQGNKPIGINMFAARLNEQTLLNLAYAFQEESGLKCLKPKLN